MKFDNGKYIKDYTTMDNEIFESIYKTKDLKPSELKVLMSICRHVVWHRPDEEVVNSSWWCAVDFTAKDCGLSKKTVQRAYRKLVQMNIITTTLRLRESNVDGKIMPRHTTWITLNTDVNSWRTCTCPGGHPEPLRRTILADGGHEACVNRAEQITISK